MSTVKDHLWLWGHPENRFYHEYGLELKSRMTPMEGALYLGARRVFMVPCGWDVDRRQYNKSFTTLKEVGWEIWNAGKDMSVIERLIDEAREFPNIGCGVFDDFVRDGQYRSIPLENLKKVSRRMHDNEVRRLNMWMVLYTHEFGVDGDADRAFEPYIDPFDGVILWTWKESDLSAFDGKFEIFRRLTPNKRRMVGCYLYDFGENRQASGKAVRWQLDRYLDLMRAHEIEGVVLHTNTMADLDFEAYDAATAWVAEHGSEEI